MTSHERVTLTWRENFANLRYMLSDAWLLLLNNVLDALGYFARTFAFIPFFVNDFNLDDSDASWIYMIYGLSCTFFAVVGGTLANKVPGPYLLAFGALCDATGSAVLVMTRDLAWIKFAMYTLFPIGMAFGSPIVLKMTKRLVWAPMHGFVVAVFYSMMNVSAAIAQFGFDIARAHSLDGKAGFGPYRTIFLISLFIEVLTTTTAFSIRTNVYVDENNKVQYVKHTNKKERGPSTWTIFVLTLYNVNFYKLLVISLLLVGPKTVFRSLETVYVLFMDRYFGSKYVGTIAAINPIMISAGLWLVQPLLEYIPYNARFLIGATVTLFSLGVMVAFGVTYFTVIMFQVLLSIGEMFWSPALNTFSMQLAPQGHEGLWISMPQIPFTLAKVINGKTSGWLLERYCPEPPGACHAREMWAMLLLITAFAPILLAVLWKCLYVPSSQLLVTKIIEDPDETTPPLIEKDKRHVAVDIGDIELRRVRDIKTITRKGVERKVYVDEDGNNMGDVTSSDDDASNDFPLGIHTHQLANTK